MKPDKPARVAAIEEELTSVQKKMLCVQHTLETLKQKEFLLIKDLKRAAKNSKFMLEPVRRLGR